MKIRCYRFEDNKVKHKRREVLLIVTLNGPIRVNIDSSPARADLKIDLEKNYVINLGISHSLYQVELDFNFM